MELTYGALRTMSDAVVRRIRRLVLSGEILVKPGDLIDPETVIGYNTSEECLHFLRLDLDEDRLLAKPLKQVGDEVKRGEPVAYYMYFFGLGYREYVSPVNGTIVSLDTANGLLGIREHPVMVKSGVYGKVDSVVPGHSVSVLSRGAWIEGTVGWGGQAHGELAVLASSAGEALDPSRLGPHCRGKIVVAGGYAGERTLLAAYRHGAAGLVAGGVDRLAGDEFWALSAGMTYEEYASRFYSAGQEAQVADAGLDRVLMPVLALDGAGNVPMRAEAFELLKANDGRVACLDGAEPGGRDNGRPELLISLPWEDTSSGAVPGAGREPEPDQVSFGIVQGLRVRVIGGPYHGRTGQVVGEAPGEMVLETGLHVLGVQVALDTGQTVGVPLANLEAVRSGP